MASIDLVTLDDLKIALGVDPTNTRKDAQYSAAITAASQAILTYTERDFGSPVVTETREFEYDGSGYLDIDDATDVTAVAFKVPNADDLVVDPTTWRAMPSHRSDAPVYYYLLLPMAGNLYPSVAMGFERNVDRYVEDYGYAQLPQIVKVTATFGWPDVPADVQLATAWTVRDWTSNPKASEGLTSEAIAGFARSWSRLAGGGVMAIPNAAKDLLADYQKIKV